MKIYVLLISLFAVFASLEVAISLEADGLCTVAAIMNNEHESECSVVDCQQRCEEIGPLLGRCNLVSDDKSKCHCYASCFALAADSDSDSDALLSSVAEAPAPLADSYSDAPLPSFNEEYNAEAPLDRISPGGPNPEHHTSPLPSFEEYNAEATLPDIEWDGAPTIWI